jgi:metal-dependent HD superfamily phosphatase/phosphodiesterase
MATPVAGNACWAFWHGSSGWLCEHLFEHYEYTNDVEYSNDVMYLYNLGVKLHESGNTSLEESYSIYSALLAADSIDFIEIKDFVEDVVKSNIDDGVVDITDIDS